MPWEGIIHGRETQMVSDWLSSHEDLGRSREIHSGRSILPSHCVDLVRQRIRNDICGIPRHTNTSDCVWILVWSLARTDCMARPAHLRFFRLSVCVLVVKQRLVQLGILVGRQPQYISAIPTSGDEMAPQDRRVLTGRALHSVHPS